MQPLYQLTHSVFSAPHFFNECHCKSNVHKGTLKYILLLLLYYPYSIPFSISLIYYWKLFLTSQHYFCDSICVSGQEKKRLHWKKENSACNVVFLSKLHCGGNAAYYIRRSNKINECDKYNHPLSHWQQIIIITNTIAITITILLLLLLLLSLKLLMLS